MQEVTREEVIAILNKLGIQVGPAHHAKHVDAKCPNGHNSSFGNFVVYTNGSGNCVCFSCHFEKKSLISLIMHMRKCNYVEAMEFAGRKYELRYDVKRSETPKTLPEKKGEQPEPQIFDYSTTTTFDPNDFVYTRQRGYTREFVREFQIRRVISGYRKDFMILPIPEANAYEFKKLVEREKLEEFLGVTGKSLKEMRALYKLGKRQEIS